MSTQEDYEKAFAQAGHTLRIIGQRNPTPEHIKMLHDGFLSDLMLGIQEGNLPQREEFRKILGIVPEEFHLDVEYHDNLDQVIEKGQYSTVSSYITEFVKKPGSAVYGAQAKIFWPKSRISMLAVERALAKEKFVPAPLEAFLFFGAMFPRSLKEKTVMGQIFLNSGRYRPVIRFNDGTRKLIIGGYGMLESDVGLLGIRREE